MPRRTKTICSDRSCSRVVDKPGYCDKHKHKRNVWKHKEPTYYRLTGRKLIRARQELFKRQPLCVMCKANGVLTPSTVRDHIVPLAFGGKECEDNVQALCEPCHDVKTQSEMKEGKRRARLQRIGIGVDSQCEARDAMRDELSREVNFVLG